MNVGVIGSGPVGRVLADGFLKRGHSVIRGTRDPSKLKDWAEAAGEKASVGTPEDAARSADIVVLAVKGAAAEDVIRLCGVDHLSGKTVIDTTNPIADAPPDRGVLKFFTTLDESLMERLQRAAPRAHFVKAFSCVGNALMVDPNLPGGPPTMFICGDDETAKSQVRALLDDFGWEVEDLGTVAAARAIEPLCILWCIPGFLGKGWMHAYKVLRLSA
jgi:predicted dinucleotide-binding enzyme